MTCFANSIHNKAYFFSAEDIERLKDISTLRNAGFSIADIRLMLESPFHISKAVRDREEELENEMKRLKQIYDTLKYLTIQEHNDVKKLADAIEPRSRYAKETIRYRKPRWVIVLAVLMVFFTLPLPYTYQGGGVFYLALFFAAGIWGGISFILMSIGYFAHCIKSHFKKNVTTGKIVAIVSNEGIEEYIGLSMFADIRQLITLGLIRWNDFRPDHWFPIIQYEMESGCMAASTFRYGGFKSFWNIGDEIKVAWEDEKKLYPKNAAWLVKKAVIHLLVGIGMLVMSGMLYYFYIK